MSNDLNVVIRIGTRDAERSAYPVELQNDGLPLGNDWATIDRQALLEIEHRYNPHDYGIELLDTLLSKKLDRAYQRLVGQAGTDAAIRVQLVIHPDAPELHALPWERLFHVLRDNETPLAADARTPFSRFLVGGAGQQPPVQARPLGLLVAIANPTGLPAGCSPLDVETEVASLVSILEGLTGQVRGTLLPGRTGLPETLRARLAGQGWALQEGVSSWQAIQRWLPGHHVLHVLAHGQFVADRAPGQGTAYLLLEHDGNEKVARGALERVPDDDIVTGLAGVTPLPQLVFLAACDSARRPEAGGEAPNANPFVGLAPRLVEAGVPAVVAMQDNVPVDLAHDLAADFYRRLFEHGQVDRALNEARSLVYERDAFAWAIPVLFLRLRDGRLFGERSLEPPQRVIFDGLIEEYTRLFAGREVALAELEQFMADPAGGFVVVKAGAGLGKTALLANLVARQRDAVAYHFFAPRVAESLQEDLFLRNLLEQMGPWYGMSEPPAGQPDEMRKRFDALLGKTPPGARTVVLDGLDEVVGWDLARYLARKLRPGLHFVLSVRDTGQDPLVDYALPADQARCVSLVGLTREGVQAVLRAAGGGASRFAGDARLLDDVYRVTAYDTTRPELGADTLFVRFLAEDAAAGRLTPAALTRLPARMETYLDRWWQAIRAEFGEEGQRQKRQRAMVDLAGTLAAALGPIGRADLEALNPSLVSDVEQDFIDTVARAVRRIVVRDQRGDYTLLHPRLRDYLRQKLKTGRYVTRLLKYCAGWPQHNSRYALTYYAAHLARAAASLPPPERQVQVETLVGLVTDTQFQDAYLAEVKDLRGLQADLERALAAAAGEDGPQTLPLLVKSARSLVQFRRERLRPEPLFDLAVQGEVQTARRMLDLFEMDTRWQQVALLEIAWLAGKAGAGEALALRREVGQAIAGLAADDQRRMLLAWVEADLDGGQRPQGDLAAAPSPWELRAILDVAAGVSPEADLSPEMLMPLSGLNWELLVAGSQAMGELEAMSEEMFFSHYIGPGMVALAHAEPQLGESYLREYLRVHSAYNYANYRFGSLWALLRPILKHPEPDWVREQVCALLTCAIGGGSVEFEEGLPLTVLALRAAGGDAGAAADLIEFRQFIGDEVARLSPGRGNGDTWGRYKRLLATLAQVQARAGDGSGELLYHAVGMRYGYAGYQAPACLALAESIRICQPVEEQEWVRQSLESAQAAAHNIQEGTFCARTTARVNAMRQKWWLPQELDVAAEIAALQAGPPLERFAALHLVEHTYDGRGGLPHSFPLPRRVREARTLDALARAYQRGLPEFVRLNRGWEPDQPIPAGSPVHVPDPGLAPLLAARLAAEALVVAGLSDAQRAALIRSLVPVAAANPTALDTVLARLLLAERPADPAILDRLADLAPLPQSEQANHLQGELTVVVP